jgi:hypothetical protein
MILPQGMICVKIIAFDKILRIQEFERSRRIPVDKKCLVLLNVIFDPENNSKVLPNRMCLCIQNKTADFLAGKHDEVFLRQSIRY